MPNITYEPVEQYLYSLLPPRDEVLTHIESEAAKRNIPIVGPAVGRLLYQLALSIQARTVFEMGSAVGYSTIWWARAIGDKGRVTYTDGDRKNADEARSYFQRAGVSSRIDVKIGDAIELLSEQKGPFDIVFCDIDKEDYPRALRLAATRVRKGGLLITDNVLWSGRVASEPATDADRSTETRAIQEFNRTLYSAQDFLTTIIPLRDGVAVALKL